MINISKNRRLLKQLKELSSKCVNLPKIKILVSKDVYDKAEKIAKELNTDVEGIFTITAYKIIGTTNYPFVYEMCYNLDKKYPLH